MTIKENVRNIHNTLPKNVMLVAVSKTKPVQDIQEAYDAGQRIFGENKVQEMCDKYQTLPKDIQWHMIGHLQRNKVKYMAHFVALIHGVDSLKLLQEINKQAQKHNRIIKCLLQIKIAKEDSKFGLSANEAVKILHSAEFKELKNIVVQGVMGMATFTENMNQVREEFRTLKLIFEELKKQFLTANQFTLISMGMSSDYLIAIEEGSTMIRVGSSIFGSRNYTT
ncbi:MAG: YggS family pyridoxal phosphate-dependent enzyme [Flavobacteriales bacterium]